MRTALGIAALVAGTSALFGDIAQDLLPYMEIYGPNKPEINVDAAVEHLINKYAALGPVSTEARRSLQFVISNGLGDDLESRLEFLVAAKSGKPRPKSESALHSMVSEKWTIASNDRFKGSKLRYRDPGNAGVGGKTKQYAGYADISAGKHLFFWFFEARTASENAPTVLWLNGGPGGSSLLGLFYELGPSRIDPELRPVDFEWAWNNNANVLFVDQPVNVGFSWSETEHVGDTVTAAQDLYVLLELFFSEFPQYAEAGFHVAAESYGGHYSPGLAAEILQHGDASFNLTSVLVGNGLTSPLIQYQHYMDMACGEGSGHDAVVDAEGCSAMRKASPQCQKLIQRCYDDQTSWACAPAQSYCNDRMWGPYSATGYNFYDVRLNCNKEPCYSDMDRFDKFLGQPSIVDALGTGEVPGGYEQCTNVYKDFFYAGDWMQPYQGNVTFLLEHGVPVLIYAGDADFSVNWLGNEAWTHNLDWSGHSEFASTPLTSWVSPSLGQEAGQARSYGPLTFLRVYDAGHMVPHDQPEASWDMLDQWIRYGALL